MTANNNLKRIALVVGMVFLPLHFLYANVLIAEIMYAPEGADATHEWIEVCSTTTQDISSWKFFESDTNHSLSLVSGSATLENGDCAVLADNATVFTEDYPSFSGNLFDSAFSLKNTGETLVLKDENSVEVDSVTYTDTDGAKDDGFSLHRSGVSLTAATPTPGTQAETGDSSGNSSDSDTGQTSDSGVSVINTTLYSYESVTIEPPQDIYVRVAQERVVTVGAPVYFTIEAYDATGTTVENGNVYWAFGDGGHAYGREVSHRFLYEGTYITSITLTQGTLSDEQHVTVQVVPLEVELTVDEKGEWVGVRNSSSHMLDISQWRLIASGQYFTIPKNTVISPESTVRFATVLTKLTTLRATPNVQLVYPDGTPAPVSSAASVDNTVVVLSEEISTPAVTTVPKKVLLPARSVVGTAVPQVEEKETPASVEDAKEIYLPSEVTETNSTAQTAAVILSTADETGSKVFYWYLGLFVVLIFASIVVLLMQPRKLIVDGFEVVESKE